MKGDLPVPSLPCTVAVVGCGAVSELFHAPALQQLEAEGVAKVVAVFDPDKNQAAKFCLRFPEAVSYPNDSFFGKVPLALAIVASPSALHEAHCVRALEAGVAVLCEKPLASDTAAAERMIAAAHRHQRILAVGLLRRFYANVQFTREVIQNQTLGAIKSFTIQEGGPFDWPARSDSFFRRKTAGGGVLLDLGVHVLDLVIHWFGEPDGLTYADDAMGGLEANCRLELSYQKGFKGTVQLSRDWKTSSDYVLEFERGTVRLEAGDAEGVQLRLRDSKIMVAGHSKGLRDSHASGGAEIPAESFQQAFLAQLRNLTLAVESGGQPAVPAEEGIRSLRLIERCYKSRSLMEMPWMTLEERKSSLLLAGVGS
jgi:predicted dehydrogenase